MLLLELINLKLQRNFSVKRWSVHLIKLAAEDRWPSWTSKAFKKFMMFSVLNKLLFPSERKSSKINKAATSFNTNICQGSLINCVANKIQQCDKMKVEKWCSLLRYLIQWIPFFANSGLSSSWWISPFLQMSHDTDMTLFTQSPAGYLSIVVNLFLFFDRDWVAWIKVGCIFMQPLSELVEAVYLHRRSSTGLFKILNYLDCSWTELELYSEEPRNDYLYNTSVRICAISASRKWETEYFLRGIQLIYDSTPRDLT